MFLILGVLLKAPLCFSAVFQGQWHPTVAAATDETSVRLLQFYLPSFFVAQSYDGQMKENWQNHQVMSESVSRWGDRIEVYGLGPLWALSNYYWGDSEKGSAHIRAISYSAIATHVLKFTVQRKRPDGSDSYSFPSGHSSDAFTTATVLSYQYGWKVGIWAYPLAGFVALSRISDNKHWLSDVVTGAFLGSWIGRAAVLRNAEPLSPDSCQFCRWQLIPIANRQLQGLELGWDWP